ncbi:MAG: 1,4-dihydroxy-2-naphthoate polyprenyltransferase, partial [Bifidobacteriaceae bacterium]|nr:1,4-dihydroxy-2-naphthoate polyprenyltransferase [Bifidobacteriaceae bacterium]
NFANDYSDGVRGTDTAERTGPQRLVGSGAAKPGAVLAAAITAFLVAGAAGVWLCLLAHHPWLIAAGVIAVVAAWFYTGGKHPYGYVGLGDIAVLVFFGLFAGLGTVYTQAGRLDWVSWLVAIAMGLIACAILMANNLRDIPTDEAAGKKTLAVRLGDSGARIAYTAEMIAAFLLVVPLLWATPRALLALFMVVPAIRGIGAVMRGAEGLTLISVLRLTGQVEFGTGLILGLALGSTAIWAS